MSSLRRTTRLRSRSSWAAWCSRRWDRRCSGAPARSRASSSCSSASSLPCRPGGSDSCLTATRSSSRRARPAQTRTARRAGFSRRARMSSLAAPTGGATLPLSTGTSFRAAGWSRGCRPSSSTSRRHRRRATSGTWARERRRTRRTRSRAARCPGRSTSFPRSATASSSRSSLSYAGAQSCHRPRARQSDPRSTAGELRSRGRRGSAHQHWKDLESGRW
mmetsp:Transcript_13840/g.43246  ORF Transcript_13840/g.43246 Transcript_13840/m.43246 type:complete len:219 (-) Transcript_13840:92-748(-)